MISRLYLRIYLTLLGALLCTSLIIGVAWRHTFEGRFMGADLTRIARELVAEIIPPPGSSTARLQATLQHWHKLTRAELALYDPHRTVLAHAGRAPPPLPPQVVDSGWIHGRGGTGGMALRLPDGRWLVANHAHGARRYPFLMALVAIAGVLALLAYPVSRRLTRRLETLKVTAQSLGEGNLQARAPVQGNDEIASLARSFNHAAQRIQSLIQSQKSLLANASHELRTPLARLRLALESLDAGTQPELQAQARRDIAELDQLIEEILLASRLEATPVSAHRFEAVDLTALAAEECARVGADLSAAALSVQGDPVLLRRALRNLLDNAARHAGGAAIEVSLARARTGSVELRVCDRGPGIPADEREKIFQPFYRIEGADRRSSGTGLGLALVKQIAESHAGQVRCEARPGGGSCFVVALPCLTGSAAPG